ncbi:MAG: M3 family metallopeptidase [Dysgonamonadaceae bacterium]|jgi:peptidyl-dipeptidase Dcp|nr:M3 family metallopeptidase [Dysgonamonadaceae bacterium]
MSISKYLAILIPLGMLMSACCDRQGKNPFFSAFDTPFDVPPFDKIKAEHYEPAFEEGIRQHQAEIDAIALNEEAATFENTVAALDYSGALLERVSNVFFALDNANTDSLMQQIAQKMTPELSAHEDCVYLNEKLFDRIKTVYDEQAGLQNPLTTEQKRLLEKYYRRFIRSGILLDSSKKQRLMEINKDLAVASLQFGQNLLAETNNYQLIIEKQSDLEGLPPGIIAAAAETAKSKGLEGKWVFTLQKPSWIPLLQYAKNRDLRKQLYQAMYNRCDNDNEYDNKAIINKIINLRLEKANILGYRTYADFELEETMAKTPGHVYKLLNDLWAHARAQAKKEADEIRQLIKKESEKFELQPFELQSWDWWYYAEKLRKEKYDLDEEELRPYFQLDSVREGAFYVAGRLYGLSFEPLRTLPVYHPEVTAYRVKDADSSFIGIIYLDYFPRAGKRVGAWMGNLNEQYKKDGKDIRPIVYNVANFTRPTDDTPSLLTPDEVETLFHEFGHALHGLLSACTYKGVSGTNVARDFVELPSQVLEHWAFQPEVLSVYAKHYRTGEVIPEHLVKRMQQASRFNQGFMTSELVAAALLDMDWHTVTQTQDFDVRAFEKNSLDRIGLIPEIIVRYRSPYFSHIFKGGYSAGYYSYIWSEVLDADAFHRFEEKGIFDPETAKSFRDNILSKGDSEDPAVLYRQFGGADPNGAYLLKNRGFK